MIGVTWLTTSTLRPAYAETIRQIHELNPGTGVENLIPDFNGRPEQLAEVRIPIPDRPGAAADRQAGRAQQVGRHGDQELKRRC